MEKKKLKFTRAEKIALGICMGFASILGPISLYGVYDTLAHKPKPEYSMYHPERNPDRLEIVIRENNRLYLCDDNNYQSNDGFDRIAAIRYDNTPIVIKDRGDDGFSDLEVRCNEARRVLKK